MSLLFLHQVLPVSGQRNARFFLHAYCHGAVLVAATPCYRLPGIGWICIGQPCRIRVLLPCWSWNRQRTDAQYQRLDRWMHELRLRGLKLAIIEIGADKAVPTVRMFLEKAASVAEATLIRINPNDFEVPDGHISLPVTAAEGIK